MDRWVDHLLGNVEGADLKKNSQSTTHVDLRVGTGSQAPGHRVSDKGPYDRLESKWYPNTINGKYEVV